MLSRNEREVKLVAKLLEIMRESCSDITYGKCNVRIPYSEWLKQKQAEYASMAGPVSVRVDKVECQRLLAQMGLSQPNQIELKIKKDGLESRA